MLFLTVPLFATPASAQAAAAWPSTAQGRPLPRPAWVLVIPARRTSKGLSIWARDDDWTRAWRVPRLVGGLRIVTLFGDAEDRRSITADAFDGMIIDSMEIVRRKYDAPAIALAVIDGNEAAVAGWAPGWPASWEPSDASGDVATSHEAAVRALSALFSGGRGTDSPSGDTPAATGAGAISAVFEAYRQVGDGTVDYKVKLSGSDDTAIEAALTRLARNGDLEISVESQANGEAELMVASRLDRAGVADAIRSAGLAVH